MSPRPKGPVDRHGMTLLELVVGLTITGLALAIGSVAFGSIIDHRDRVEHATDMVTRAAAERRTLIAWLAGARLTVNEGGPSFRGLDGVAGHSPDDDVSFLTTARTPIGDGEAVVHLSIDRDSTTPERGLVAELMEWPGTRRQRVEIDSQVAALDVHYLTGMLGEQRWLPSWISSTVLPAGVRVTLAGAAPDTLPPLLRLPIVVPLRGGQ